MKISEGELRGNIMKILKGLYLVPGLLIGYLYFLFRVYINKVGRLLLRFLRRLIEIWYIGFTVMFICLLLVISGRLTGSEVMFFTFVPGLINTMILVYLIDFLRIEYDRKKDVNRHYLFNLELEKMRIHISHNFEDIFGIEIECSENSSLSMKSIENIIDGKENFWDEYVIRRKSIFDQQNAYVTKNKLFLDTMKFATAESKHMIQSYITSSPYKEYRILHKIKRVTSIFDQSDYDCNLISGNWWSFPIFEIIESIFEIEKIIDENWQKDYKLVGNLNSYQQKFNEFLGVDWLKEF